MKSDVNLLFDSNESHELYSKLNEFILECRKINIVYIAIAGKTFPILLTPNPDKELDHLNSLIFCKLYFDNEGWYIANALGEILFSFDLPKELFRLYEEEGIITKQKALDIKETFFAEIRINTEIENEFRSINLILDRDWIQKIRSNIRERRE